MPAESKTPFNDSKPSGRDDAGSDPSIERELIDDPDSADAKLDEGLDESMDASDPPSVTIPSDTGEPAPSSGYDADAEKARKSKQ